MKLLYRSVVAILICAGAGFILTGNITPGLILLFLGLVLA